MVAVMTDPLEPAAEAVETPDFDSYSLAHRPIAASSYGSGVRVLWDDGLECHYHPLWLRENACDGATTHPVTREQALQLLDIPADLSALEAAITAGGELQVHWSTGEQSRFHPGWLRTHSFGADEALGRLPDRRLWSASLQERLPRFDGRAVLADEAVRGCWAEALHVYGVALLDNLPATPEVVEIVPALLGPIRVTNFGRVFDVRTRADADSNAYTTMTLPLHCDLATREYMPGLQFLHCIHNAARGGDSLLADGFQLAEVIARDAPEHFETLATVALTHANKAIDTDHRWQTPMICRGPDGRLSEVRWSPWLRAPVRAPIHEVDRIYRALRYAFRLAADPAYQVSVRLRPGELLGFDNRRVLHGRTGFDPATGERWLRGCYVEREELHSRLRILARQRRKQGNFGSG